MFAGPTLAEALASGSAPRTQLHFNDFLE